MTKEEKRLEKVSLKNLQDDTKLLMNKKEVREFIDIFNSIGIKYSNMACGFKANIKQQQVVLDLVAFYPDKPKTPENIMLILDLSHEFNEKKKYIDSNNEELIGIARKYFSSLPSLGFVVVNTTKEPKYIFKTIQQNQILFYTSTETPEF